MLPDEIDTKTGDAVLDVLKSKHPEMSAPDVSLMEEHDALPDFVELEVTAGTVKKVARRLSGSAGPGGPAHQTCNIGSFDVEVPAQNFEKQWWNSCGGKPTTIHHGPRAKPFEQDNSWQLTKCQKSVHQGSKRHLKGSNQNVFCLFVEMRPKKLVEWTSCVRASRQELKLAHTLPNFFGKNTPTKRNADSFWWMPAMHSMKAT
jgi:hypothetical protein